MLNGFQNRFNEDTRDEIIDFSLTKKNIDSYYYLRGLTSAAIDEPTLKINL